MLAETRKVGLAAPVHKPVPGPSIRLTQLPEVLRGFGRVGLSLRTQGCLAAITDPQKEILQQAVMMMRANDVSEGVGLERFLTGLRLDGGSAALEIEASVATWPGFYAVALKVSAEEINRSRTFTSHVDFPNLPKDLR